MGCSGGIEDKIHGGVECVVLPQENGIIIDKIPAIQGFERNDLIAYILPGSFLEYFLFLLYRTGICTGSRPGW